MEKQPTIPGFFQFFEKITFTQQKPFVVLLFKQIPHWKTSAFQQEPTEGIIAFPRLFIVKITALGNSTMATKGTKSTIPSRKVRTIALQKFIFHQQQWAPEAWNFTHRLPPASATSSLSGLMINGQTV